MPSLLTAICVIPFLSYLVNLRSMSRLAPFSLFADFANILGLFIVFVQDVTYLPLNHEHITAFNFSYLLYVTSVTVYCFEGVGLILPLESSSTDRKGFPRLLTIVLASITCLMVCFGTLGYMGFGHGTLSPITLNLSGPTATLVKLSLCTGLYLTYPVMMFPVNTVLEEVFSISGGSKVRVRWAERWIQAR
jgi:proton-coupled amino acid transporter